VTPAEVAQAQQTRERLAEAGVPDADTATENYTSQFDAREWSGLDDVFAEFEDGAALGQSLAATDSEFQRTIRRIGNPYSNDPFPDYWDSRAAAEQLAYERWQAAIASGDLSPSQAYDAYGNPNTRLFQTQSPYGGTYGGFGSPANIRQWQEQSLQNRLADIEDAAIALASRVAGASGESVDVSNEAEALANAIERYYDAYEQLVKTGNPAAGFPTTPLGYQGNGTRLNNLSEAHAAIAPHLRRVATDLAIAESGLLWTDRGVTVVSFAIPAGGIAKVFIKESFEEGLTRTLIFSGQVAVGYAVSEGLEQIEDAADLPEVTSTYISVAFDIASVVLQKRRQARSPSSDTNVAEPQRTVNRNLRDYVGQSHVYVIKAPNGSVYKVGKSSGGTRKRDDLSIRAENQVRRLNREDVANGGAGGYSSQIRRDNLPGSGAALDYETRWRDTYRRLFGQDLLPGNREHLRGRRL
jgi:hypothetical protein